MQQEDFESTDPHLLVGIVNTALRNENEDLTGLCAAYDIDESVLSKRLGDAGYAYLPEQRRFS